MDVAFPVISNSDTERLESEGVAGHERGDEQEIQWNLGDDVDQDGGEVDGVGKAAVEVPPRPISPLGRGKPLVGLLCVDRRLSCMISLPLDHC